MIARLVLLLLLALISGTLAAAANGAYPGKNGKIAFVRGAWIYTIDAGGKNAQRLVRGGGPAWSPDGAQIAFHRDAGVFVMNADGKSVRQLTSEYENSPAWSPDGTKLVFSRQQGSLTGLVVLDLARGTLTRLTTSVGDGAPTWQPLP